MRLKQRWFLAGAIAALFMAMMTLLLLRSDEQPNVAAPEQPAETVAIASHETGETAHISSNSVPALPPGTAPPEPKVTPPGFPLGSEELADERPIEEVLAEAGEDSGAVFYMSRVREALSEGNPRFARDLLRQMGQLHPDSVLVQEAQQLFKKR